MIQLGKDIYANFDIKDIPNEKQKKVRAVVMGNCGSGKTTLFNNLCDKKYLTAQSNGESITRDIDFEDVKQIKDSGFRMYDTPGTNSISDALHHALTLRISLTSLQINLIMVSVSLYNRFMNTFKELQQLLQIFKGYEKYVVCLVSHLDTLNHQPSQKQQVIKEIGDKSRQLKQLKLILYSNVNFNFKQLSQTLFKLGKSNKITKIKIDDKTFFQYFNISCKIYLIQNKYVQQITEEIELFFNFVEKFDQQSAKNRIVQVNFFDQWLSNDVQEINYFNQQKPNKTEIFFQLKHFMKYYLKNLQQKQYKEYSKQFNNDQKTTDLYLATSQLIQSKLQQFQDKIKDVNKQTFYDVSEERSIDIRDLIKACPNCHQIWMKNLGCNKVRCGQKSTYADELFVKKTSKYNFEIIGEKEERKITYSTQHKKKWTPIPKQKKQQVLKDEKRTGCGYQFQWDKTKRLQISDDVWKELFGVSNFEEIKLSINWLKMNYHQLIAALDAKLKKTGDKIQKQSDIW